MIKRLLATAGPLVVAGAVPAALSLGSASAAAVPLLGSVPNSALAPVAGAASALTKATGLSLFGSAPVVNAANHAATPAAPHAPASHATANGLKLNVLDTCVSCTGASADRGSSSAGSQALRLLGNDISAGQAASTSSNSGALLALPANPLLGLALADWMNQAQASGIDSLAHARSALVDASVANGQLATLAVLEGMSNASYSGASSHGDGATNGADLTLLGGGLAVILLHSGSSSDGQQGVYVVALNNMQLLSSQQGVGDIPISIPGVATIDLLQTAASGGLGSSAIGAVSDLLGSAGPAAGVLSTDSDGSPAAMTAAAPVAAGAASSAAAHRSTASAIAEHLRAPMTGASIGFAGLALLFSGISVVAAALRRRQTR